MFTSMSDFKTNQLKKLDNLLIVVSTHGDGEPPDNAISFHEFLHGKRAPKLDGLIILFWLLEINPMTNSVRQGKNLMSA